MVPESLDPAPSLNYVRPNPPSTMEYFQMFLRQGIVHSDIDGCAVENEHVHVQSWIDLADSYDVVLTNELFDVTHSICVPVENGGAKIAKQPLRGSDPTVISCWILGQHNSDIAAGAVDMWTMREEIAQMREAHLQGFLKNKDMLRPREGYIDIIEALRDNNWIIGAVTGSKRPIFEANMHVLGKAAKIWDYVVTAEEVSLKKPDPTPYLLGLAKSAQLMGTESPVDRQLHILTKRSLSFEDGLSGVKSSVLANIPCVQFILPEQAVFKEDLPYRSMDNWVFPATSDKALRAQTNKVAGRFFAPKPALI